MSATWRGRLAILVLALGVVAAPARPAHACSHPAQIDAPYLAFPSPGAVDVPTNVVFTVDQSTYMDAQPPFQLRDPDGHLTGTTTVRMGRWGTGDLGTTSWRVSAAAPLAPLTAYELLVVDGDVVQVLGQVTTGSGADLVAPAAPQVASLTVGLAHSCLTNAFQCCFPDPRVVDVALAPSAATEPVAYTLREAATVVGVDQLAPLDGLATCDGSVPSFRYSAGPDRPPEWMVAGGAHELTLVARDLAGNESPPVTVHLMAECHEADAGVAVADAGTAETPPSDGGCGCRVGARPSRRTWTGLAALLGLFGLFVRRRRR
jgi:MYXO-CTERM domain-containing protein